ncbi:MAG: alanine/glycine:cation symporter family protein [Desulfovibrionaceae bacterium]
MEESATSFLVLCMDMVGVLTSGLWSILLYLLVIVGIYFTIRMAFIQFRLLGHAWKRLIFAQKFSSEGISTFGSFATSLGNKVGTGNIIGISIAIGTGGPGAIFWMWILALLGMATAFAESTLGQFYRVKTTEHRFKGGPAYYVQNALNMRWLGIIFAVALCFAMGLIFNAVQTNSITTSFIGAFGFGDPRIIGLVIMLGTAIIIFGGLHKISQVTTILVPFMAILYIFVAIVIVLLNFDKVPSIFMLIFESAFGITPLIGGVAGYSLMTAMTVGAQRGLFSNEAGMGSAPNIAATTSEKHPATQGLIQMVGVFVDTIIVCTSTALIILLSGLYMPEHGIIGAELTQRAMESQLGLFGKYFITCVLFLFAFTSILGNYAFAEDNITFIKNSKSAVIMFRILVLIVMYIGANGSIPFVWQMADLASGIMAIINLFAIVLLSKKVLILVKDYTAQLREGKSEPVLDISKYPELTKDLKENTWK